MAVRGRRGAAAGRSPTRLLVVGMGRLGGGEMGYGSDADVLFVHDPLAGGRRGARRRRPRSRSSRSCAGCSAPPGPDPQLGPGRRPAARGQERPAGAQRWQSYRGLLRALVAGLGGAGAAAGHARRGRRRAGPGASSTLIDPLRWPAGGLSDARTSARSARLKARVEAERLPRGADPEAAPQARAAAGWPTSSGPCSCCSCGTPARCRRCARPRTLHGAGRGADGGPARRGGRRGARRRLAAGLAAAQRRGAVAGTPGRRRAQRPARRRRHRADRRPGAGHAAPRWPRTTAGWRVAPDLPSCRTSTKAPEAGNVSAMDDPGGGPNGTGAAMPSYASCSACAPSSPSSPHHPVGVGRPAGAADRRRVRPRPGRARRWPPPRPSPSASSPRCSAGACSAHRRPLPVPQRPHRGQRRAGRAGRRHHRRGRRGVVAGVAAVAAVPPRARRRAGGHVDADPAHRTCSRTAGSSPGRWA